MTEQDRYRVGKFIDVMMQRAYLLVGEVSTTVEHKTVAMKMVAAMTEAGEWYGLDFYETSKLHDEYKGGSQPNAMNAWPSCAKNDHPRRKDADYED